MASPQMFINNPLTISQDADVYGQNLAQGNYDYTFVINVASFAADITSIFTNAAYIQNSTNIDAYDVNLVIDPHTTFTNWSTVFNNQNIVSILQGDSNVNFATLQGTSNKTVGDRLLEVVAHKLFGHGQARAAISNDTEFYTHDAAVWDHLSNSVALSNMRNDIFNQYVASGRYESETQNGLNNGNDVNGWVNFNFNSFTFDYPLYVSGNILTDASLTNDERNLVQNGPNVGGTVLANGLYNIPVLVRFTQ